ncbi:hypothetical protein OH76DRAFT_462358 [Lentinus brumalis]|uniref:F-box domain-containing protein n=1 Tax=Lentinus brumalis TaxID=2498619 RepID=A0A371DCG1_9APHY|nr:hypothetical protein OH76DRAFT_462358 [Polyporus brumalis]
MEKSSVQALPQDHLERFQGLRSSELQTSALVALNEYEEKAREYQEKLRELREHYIPEVKSIYNSGALINQLPIELIIHIFRFVGPRTSPADAIRLTHICRLWRLLIHQAPTFWSDLLDAEDVLARTWHDNAMVLAAFDRSEPVTQIGFSMYGSFLPLLETVPVHASRISTLWLDAAVIEEQDRTRS